MLKMRPKNSEFLYLYAVLRCCMAWRRVSKTRRGGVRSRTKLYTVPLQTLYRTYIPNN